MPLIPLEPFVYPEDVLTQPPTVGESLANWWVLHARPRAEKSLARKLLANKAPFYLPLYHKRGSARSGPRSSFLPLFPGYVFLFGDAQTRLSALKTNDVAYCLEVLDQERLISDLQRVQKLLATEAPLTPEDRLQPGDPVEIVAGPFSGMRGKLIRRGRELRLLVEVQFLQRGVSVEVESWMIEAAQ